MDTSTFFVGAILLALIVLPIVFIQRAGNNRKKKLYQQLLKYSNTPVLEYSIIDNAIIGIDETVYKVFYIAKQGETETRLTISLTKTTRCKIIETQKLIDGQKKTERLELAFLKNETGETPVLITFYDAQKSGFLMNDEQEMIKKWHRIIENQLQLLS